MRFYQIATDMVYSSSPSVIQFPAANDVSGIEGVLVAANTVQGESTYIVEASYDPNNPYAWFIVASSNGVVSQKVLFAPYWRVRYTDNIDGNSVNAWIAFPTG